MPQESQKTSTIPIPMYGLMAATLTIVAVILGYLLLRNHRKDDIPTDHERLLALARAHPDKSIRKDLLEAVREGEVALDVDDIAGGVNGTFAVSYGEPTITIDTTLLTASATPAGREIAFAVLFHEALHYRQWLTRQAVRDLHAAYLTSSGLTAAQCTLKVLVEVEAYAETCNAARLYRWNAAIEPQCGNVSASRRARSFLDKIHDLRECTPVWKHLVADELALPEVHIEEPADMPDEDASGGMP